jgi:acyl-homoserine lactone synthase
MIRVITGRDAHFHPELFDRLYKARHRVFVTKMGWVNLTQPDGRERDQFDFDSALHFIGFEGDRIASYTRLLPTTGPHLLRDVYPELLDGAEAPRRPDVYEWTRLFTDPTQATTRLSKAGRELFVAIAEFCETEGLNSLIAQSDPMWIPRLLQLGWEARPLALPMEYEGQTVLALEAHLTPYTVARTRRILGVDYPVFKPTSIPISAATSHSAIRAN